MRRILFLISSLFLVSCNDIKPIALKTQKMPIDMNFKKLITTNNCKTLQCERKIHLKNYIIMQENLEKIFNVCGQ